MTDALQSALNIVREKRSAIERAANDLEALLSEAVELYELPPSAECLQALSNAADLECELFGDCAASTRLAELLEISEEFDQHDSERVSLSNAAFSVSKAFPSSRR